MKKTMASLLFASLVALAGCHSSSNPPSTPSPAPIEGEPAPGACVRSGCSGTVCVSEGKEVVTTCEFKPEYACYDKAKCEQQTSGECGWTRSAEFDACMASGGAKQE